MIEQEEFFKELEVNYKDFCKSSSLQDIKSLLDELDQRYYNNLPNTYIVSDYVYNWINDYYYSNTKTQKSKVGAEIQGRDKVKLPIYMGSMDKIKPNTPELKNFLKNYTNQKCISEKLDGISFLMKIDKNNNISLYKRGDGFYGQDKSNLYDYLFGDEKYDLDLIHNKPYYVRGELVITKKNWEKIKDLGKNSRNFISGLTNRKDITQKDIELFKWIDFVAYELIDDSQFLSIQQQLELLEKMNFKVVKYEIIKNVSEKILISKLTEFRLKSEYEIDGIIVQDNIYYPRISGGNPRYAKAFKDDDDCMKVTTNVLGVEWNPSKDGLLKPVVLVEDVEVDGVTISRVTGINAKFIVDNKIGKGTKLTLIRSGGVIPKIMEILVPTQPNLPNVNYEWDKNKVEFILIQKDNREVHIKQIEHFINTLGIEFYKASTISKGYDVGIKTIDDLFTITKEQLLQIEGIKDKSADKILKSIQSKLVDTKINVGVLAAATPFFKGLGIKRLTLIFDEIPNILKLQSTIVYDKVIHLDGFSDNLTKVFVHGLRDFKKFIERNVNFSEQKSVKEKEHIKKDKVDKVYGKKFVFSGFRNKEMENVITTNGGQVMNSISGKTDYLVVKDKNNITEKVKKASEKGIKIIDMDELNVLIK